MRTVHLKRLAYVWTSKFACKAARTAFWLGILSALLQIANRSLLEQQVVLDEMTLSGVCLFLASMVLYSADSYPWLKRASGAFGLAYITLLILDAYGKTGYWGVVGGTSITAIICVLMILEQKSGKFAPVFWSSMVGAATKLGTLWYAVANKEIFFIAAVLLAIFENVAVSMTDNKVRAYFKVEKRLRF